MMNDNISVDFMIITQLLVAVLKLSMIIFYLPIVAELRHKATLFGFEVAWWHQTIAWTITWTISKVQQNSS